jgi:hypothetical protein
MLNNKLEIMWEEVVAAWSVSEYSWRAWERNENPSLYELLSNQDLNPGPIEYAAEGQPLGQDIRSLRMWRVGNKFPSQ